MAWSFWRWERWEFTDNGGNISFMSQHFDPWARAPWNWRFSSFAPTRSPGIVRGGSQEAVAAISRDPCAGHGARYRRPGGHAQGIASIPLAWASGLSRAGAGGRGGGKDRLRAKPYQRARP